MGDKLTDELPLSILSKLARNNCVDQYPRVSLPAVFQGIYDDTYSAVQARGVLKKTIFWNQTVTGTWVTDEAMQTMKVVFNENDVELYSLPKA
jgi:hypothetical protein